MSTGSEWERFLDELWESVGFREKDLAFIRLYANRKPDPEAWSAFFASVDLATEPYPFNCMLTRLAARTEWAGVPDEMVPTLSGLRKKLIMSNALQISDAMKLIRKLNEEQIPVLVVKGGAMRLSLLSDLPRKMADIDFVVPEEKRLACWKAAYAAGYHTREFGMHSLDLHLGNRSAVDIHCIMFKSNLQKPEPVELLQKDAAVLERQGVRFSVPSPEDAFLMTMTNAVDDYLVGSGKGPVTWIADCADLADRYELDYAKIAEHAEAFHVQTLFRIAIAFLQRILPERFRDLCCLADAPVSRRAVRRCRALLKAKAYGQPNIRNLPVLQRAWRRMKYIRTVYAGLYHPDDSMLTLITGIPDMVKKWQKTESLREVPDHFISTAKRWIKNREETKDADSERK